MLPFRPSPHFARLISPYPEAADIARVCAEGGERARIALARLWLSEGIPFAFRQNPALYEEVRTWLASRVGTEPKQITIIGSGRIGQSLEPKKLGTPFSEKSDLDLTIVSRDVFDKFAFEFNRWANDYESGTIKPKNELEKTYWKDNMRRGSGLLRRGFMDSKMIPLREQYPYSCHVGQTMYLLTEKLRLTQGAPVIGKADIRAYRDWKDFTEQMTRNLCF